MIQVPDQIRGALTGDVIQRQEVVFQVAANAGFRRSGNRMQDEQSTLVHLYGNGFTVEGRQDRVLIQLPMQIFSGVPQLVVQPVFCLDGRHQQDLHGTK